MIRRLFAVLFAFALAALLLQALSSSNPVWAPSSAFTNDTLNCTWAVPPDALAQNITILRGGTLYQTSYENASEMTLNTTWTIPSDATEKGESWTCRIAHFNATANQTTSALLTILNSLPVLEGLPAGIFNAGSDIGSLVQIDEDALLQLDANATDADGDPITYGLIGTSFCTLSSSALGTYSCTPVQEDLTGNSPTLKNISFTAEDASGGTIRKVTFNITPVNDAPSASIANQTTPVNESHNVTFDATDEEGDSPITAQLIFNASNDEINSSLSIVAVNGTRFRIEYDGAAPDFNDVGTWPVWINLTDPEGAGRTVSYFFDIAAVGRPPFFTAISPGSVINGTQGQFLQVNISANDPDTNETIGFFDDSPKFSIVTLQQETNASDAQAQINFTPTNADVGVFSVTITLQDQENLENETTLTFNITNVNDPPVIHEVSLSEANTQQNQNASNLSAYVSAPFVYDVNATDADLIHNDSLAYSDNTSLFAIDPSSGRISFTPTAGQIGSHSINVTAADEQGAEASRTILIEIRSNQPPQFTQQLAQLNCTTGSECSFDLSSVSTDPDAGDGVASYAIAFLNGSPAGFSYNATSGVINFTPAKQSVGNYTLNVTIADTFGAQNSTTMALRIDNTQVAPTLIRYNLSSLTIVETHLATYDLQATDEDLLVASAQENLTFATNLSLSHEIAVYTSLNSTARQATLSFTPQIGDAGNYTIEINVTDVAGGSDSRTITIEVLPKVPPPQFASIAPWGAAPGYALNTTAVNASLFAQNATNVTFSENATVLFAANVTSTRPLTYNWTYDGTQIGSSSSVSRSFGFFSAGSHTVRLNVSHDLFEHSVFTWRLTTQNLNRLPQLRQNLPNATVNGSSQLADYFTGAGGQRFYDPDDDLDSDGTIDGSESNSLTFGTSGQCSAATLSISGSSLTITGTQVGSCTLAFLATDASGATVQSNTVRINITQLPEGSSETVTTVSSGGGGGGSSSTSYIPLDRERETPKAFTLIAPRLVTIYENDSLIIPIKVNNTWTSELSYIRLYAESNATGVSVEMNTDLIETLQENETREILLTVSGYRLGQNYEVVVGGNVSDPEYHDEALILLNSIEQASDGEEVEVKVTFANDLVSQNPECQELNEVLEQATEELARGNTAEANRIVDSVINGCKYLVSTQKRIEDKPSRVNPIVHINDVSFRTMMWSLLSFVFLVSIAMLIYYHYSHDPNEDF